MSILSMLMGTIVKDIKANVKIQAALQELENVENQVMPLVAKIDQVALAKEVAALSEGKLTEAEVLGAEVAIENAFKALETLATELEVVAKK